MYSCQNCVQPFLGHAERGYRRRRGKDVYEVVRSLGRRIAVGRSCGGMLFQRSRLRYSEGGMPMIFVKTREK